MRKAHGQALRAFHKVDKGRQVMVDRALGSWHAELLEVAASTHSMELLYAMGYRRCQDEGVGDGVADEDEEDLAIFHLRLVAHLLGQRMKVLRGRWDIWFWANMRS